MIGLLLARDISREECTSRFVRAFTHWLRGEDEAAQAWLKAALLHLPEVS